MDPSDRWSAALTAEGMPDDGRTPPNHLLKVVSLGTFETLGTPLVAGRDFTWTNAYDLRAVAIVSANLASEIHFSCPSPVDRTLNQNATQTGEDVRRPKEV
jgi:hypothetical protein